jgi:hypothetical protein
LRLIAVTNFRKKGGDRTDRDLDAVSAACRHRPVNRDQLIEAESQIGTIRLLHGEVVDERQ